MSDLMKLSKQKLVVMVEGGKSRMQRYADQLISSGEKLVHLDSEILKLNGRIVTLKSEHSRDLKADQKAITELKMQIKGDSKRFDGINMAIDTVFAIKYPGRDIYYAQYPDDEAVNLDDNFYMLQHFKRLVSLQNNADYTGAGIRDFMQ